MSIPNEPTGKNVEELMQQLPAENEAAEQDRNGCHFANGHWLQYPVCGLMLQDHRLNECMWEWSMRRTEVAAGIITREEYSAWKPNWSETCEFGGSQMANS